MPRLTRTPLKTPMLYSKDINRLISSMQLTGKIIFQEDFEKYVMTGADESIDPAGANGEICRVTETHYSGAACLMLRNPYASAGHAEWVKHIGWYGDPNRKFGVEFKWALHGSAGIDFLWFGLEFFDRSSPMNWTLYLVKWHPDEDKWYVYKPGGDSDVAVLNQQLGTDKVNWHTFKLICNNKNKSFDTLFSDDKEVDLTAYRAYETTATQVEKNIGVIKIPIVIKALTSGYTIKQLYIDDLILTLEE